MQQQGHEFHLMFIDRLPDRAPVALPSQQGGTDQGEEQGPGAFAPRFAKIRDFHDGVHQCAILRFARHYNRSNWQVRRMVVTDIFFTTTLTQPYNPVPVIDRVIRQLYNRERPDGGLGYGISAEVKRGRLRNHSRATRP